jgi:hypothetical protein
VTGESAVVNAVLKAFPPAVITPVVFAFCDTKTAMIATPIMAVKTVTTDEINWSDILTSFPFGYKYVNGDVPELPLKLIGFALEVRPLVDDPVIGPSAVPRMEENAFPPEVITCAVCAF